MNRLLLVIIFIGALTVGCSKENNVSISGEVLNPGIIKVVSFYEGERKLDSVFLSDQNKFKFNRPSNQPRLLSMQIGKTRYPIILTPGEDVHFSTDLQNDPNDYIITGSSMSTALKTFAPIKQKKEFIEDSLQNEFLKLIADKSEPEVESIRAEYLRVYRESLQFYTEEAKNFAKKAPNLAGFYAMSTLDPDLAENELIDYVDGLEGDFVENRVVSKFIEEINKLKRLAIGQPAPNFEAFTPTNKSMKLSDFRGKYTLVDFWASWCAPCRKENPNLLKVYNKYKDNNFTILGVSLDNNPGSWMRAIDEDELAWNNVSDLKAWSSDLIIDYRIKAIPASFLVDPDGNILAKNLRSHELDSILMQVLK